MERVKEEIQMKVMKEVKKLGRRAVDRLGLSGEADCPEEVKKAVEAIKAKMAQSKIGELHPPFLSKTITRFRHEYFLPLKKQFHSKLSSPNPQEFLSGLSILRHFIVQLDCQYFDLYLEQVREPYIRKMFSENYQFDKLDFKEINTEYKVRTEIEELLNVAAEWLIQLERTQDLLERVELYFDVKSPVVLEKAKKQGIEHGQDRTWGEAVSSMIRNVTSYTLRKSSKIIQSSFFTVVAPAAAMLTLAIIGGSATLPFPSDLNIKLLITPLIAICVPYALDEVASTIERSEFIQIMGEWTVGLQRVGVSIAKFNEELEQTILACCSAASSEDYAKERLNLEKYMKALEGNLGNLTSFSEAHFQEMRDRTEAYFRKYVEIQDGDWTVVIPADEYDQLSGRIGKLT